MSSPFDLTVHVSVSSLVRLSCEVHPSRGRVGAVEGFLTHMGAAGAVAANLLGHLRGAQETFAHPIILTDRLLVITCVKRGGIAKVSSSSSSSFAHPNHFDPQTVR